MRSTMLEVIRQDYITTARAKGLSERVVIYRHALRNALLPVITLLGFSIPGLIGGSVIFETIFAIPGMGQLFYMGVMSRDYPLVMGILVIGACPYSGRQSPGRYGLCLCRSAHPSRQRMTASAKVHLRVPLPLPSLRRSAATPHSTGKRALHMELFRAVEEVICATQIKESLHVGERKLFLSGILEKVPPQPFCRGGGSGGCRPFPAILSGALYYPL